MELSSYELEGLATAALLHDVGRIALPHRASGSEAAISAHPALGTDILAAIDFPYPVREYVESLGERWDGGGRPRGLCGDTIPAGARILAAVDWFDAQDRAERSDGGSAPRRCRARLRAEAGRRFDPLVVDLLLDAVDRESQTSEPSEREPVDAERDPTLERADRELQMLYEIGRSLTLPLDLDQRLTLAATRLADSIPFDALAIVLGDGDDGTAAVRFVHGRTARALRRRLQGVPDGIEPARRIAPPRIDGKSLEVPLIEAGARLGTLWLHRDDGSPFAARDRSLVVAVAGRIASSVQGDAAGKRRRRRSLTDPVTGLPNARYVRLHCAHRLADRDSRFGLIALQLRGLDAVGERLGAAAVDDLITRAARRLAMAVRKTDLVARFGPDQFLVFTREHEAGALVTTWTRLVQLVEAEQVEEVADETRIRVAGAHVAYPESGPGFEELLAALSRRLPPPQRERSVVPFHAAAAGA